MYRLWDTWGMYRWSTSVTAWSALKEPSPSPQCSERDCQSSRSVHHQVQPFISVCVFSFRSLIAVLCSVSCLQELNLSFGEITEAAALVVAQAVMDKPHMEKVDLNGMHADCWTTYFPGVYTNENSVIEHNLIYMVGIYVLFNVYFILYNLKKYCLRYKSHLNSYHKSYFKSCWLVRWLQTSQTQELTSTVDIRNDMEIVFFFMENTWHFSVNYVNM